MRVHLLQHVQTTPCEPMPWHELRWHHDTMPCTAQSASWHDMSQHAMPSQVDTHQHVSHVTLLMTHAII